MCIEHSQLPNYFFFSKIFLYFIRLEFSILICSKVLYFSVKLVFHHAIELSKAFHSFILGFQHIQSVKLSAIISVKNVVLVSVY